MRPGVPGIGQNSAESFSVRAAWTTYFVAEVHLTKDDFSFVPVFAGGIRWQKPFNPQGFRDV